jgi:hypothetical protein
MLEIVPVLAIFILVINFSLGFFGLIHSGILNTIAARNYAFETFRNRADLNYIRDTGSDISFVYSTSEMRFHTIRNETTAGVDELKFYATRRPIKFSDIHEVSDLRDSPQQHEQDKAIAEGKRASESGIDEGVNPAWVRSAYGICLVANCGG